MKVYWVSGTIHDDFGADRRDLYIMAENAGNARNLYRKHFKDIDRTALVVIHVLLEMDETKERVLL